MNEFKHELIEKKRIREEKYDQTVNIKRIKSDNFKYKLSFEHSRTNDSLVEEMNRQDELKMMSENDFDSLSDEQLAKEIIQFSIFKPCPPPDDDYKKCNYLDCFYCYPYLPGSESLIVEELRRKKVRRLKKREKTFAIRRHELSKLVKVFVQEDTEDFTQKFAMRELKMAEKTFVVSDKTWLNYLERESGIQSSFETIEEAYEWLSGNWPKLSARTINVNFFGEKYKLNRKMNNPQFILGRDITVILTWYDYWIVCPDFYDFGEKYLPMPMELLRLVIGKSTTTKFEKELKEITIPLKINGYLDDDLTDIWLS